MGIKAQHVRRWQQPLWQRPTVTPEKSIPPRSGQILSHEKDIKQPIVQQLHNCEIDHLEESALHI